MNNQNNLNISKRTTKILGLSFLLIFGIWSCKSEKNIVEEVTKFKGQQVTGLTISDDGTMFANFPRWRKGVTNSVVKINQNGNPEPYPDKKWNTWEIDQTINDSVFVAVQSVIAHEKNLYVLDTRNPLFNGVIGNPKIFVFNLESNKLIHTYTLPEKDFHKDSYINDLRIDKKNKKIYLTDSGHAGLVIIDIASGESKRVLDNHVSTLSETNHLTFNGQKWTNIVHSDGIALDIKNDILYYHALTGYSLYSIPTKILIEGNEQEIQKNVKLVTKTSAPDGMIFDEFGNLYFADLENQKIMKLTISNNKIEVIAQGDKIKWADTFSIYNNELYFTNSRINEVSENISNMIFDINKIKIK